MACTCPETYYRRDPSKFNGVKGLTQDARKALLSVAGTLQLVTIPCGKCVDCRLAYARDWSLRCMHELQTSPAGGCFVTLTYDDARLPADHSLHYEDFQLFMHRVRNRYSDVRFFMCGEYGDDFGRPHYHAILFNLVFDDLVFLRKEGKIELFKSQELSELWGLGFVSVGAVTRHSASYVARYSLKKISGPLAGSAYQWVDPYSGEVYDRTPPFSKQSLKPGIGAFWFERYHGDVFPCDEIVFDGRKYPVPRYYMKLYERLDPKRAEGVKAAHVAHAREMRKHPDNTSRRLRDRWEVSVLNSKNVKRNKF